MTVSVCAHVLQHPNELQNTNTFRSAKFAITDTQILNKRQWDFV